MIHDKLLAYSLEPLREDGEFVLYRGVRSNQTGSPTVLMLAATSSVRAVFTTYCKSRTDDGLLSCGSRLTRKTYSRPVNSSSVIKLDETILAQFPIGYRHLAYVQELAGYKVKRDMPGLKGPDTEALYAHCRAWLKGGPALWKRS